MAKKKDKNIDNLSKGIFSLRTNFGELAQLMHQKDMGLHRPMITHTTLKMMTVVE